MARTKGTAILNFAVARRAAKRGKSVRCAIDPSKGSARVIAVWVAGERTFTRTKPSGQYRVHVTFKREREREEAE